MCGRLPAYGGMPDHPLIADVEAFIATHSIAESTFGRLAVNDWKLVRDLRGRKRHLWPETEAKVRHFMATYRPTEQTSAAA